MEDKLLDIIIPAWKAQKTIIKTLSSIAEQSISDMCKITIVNDCDGIGYDNIVNIFKPILDIQVLNLEKNAGPGVARQHGLDNTYLPYIVFADADDTFYGSFALQILFENIEAFPKCGVILAEHYLEVNNPDLKFVLYKPNYVWTFGKIYRRAVLKKYNIHFNESRSNEDVGFNKILKLCTIGNEEEKGLILNQVVYCWHDNPNSITRANSDFVFSENITGYIYNLRYAFRKVSAMNLNNKHFIQKDIIQSMADLYIFFIESYAHSKKFADENFKACVEFYKEFFEIIELTQDSTFINKLILEEIKNKSETITQIIPEMTYYQFMDKIREEANKD